MGMLDNYFIEDHLLPEDLRGKKHHWLGRADDVPWHTWDSDIYLDEGVIRIITYSWEEVPKEEKPYPDATGIKALLGSRRRVLPGNREEIWDYHGDLHIWSFEETTINLRIRYTEGRITEVIQTGEYEGPFG